MVKPSSNDPSRSVSGPERLLYLLKQKGPADAESLAVELEVTGTAIRQHLYRLRDEGLVEARSERRPMGRPAKIWQLTPAAAARFPQAGSPLIESFLRSSQAALSESGMHAAICGCVEDQVGRYQQALTGKRTLKSKLNALVAMRSRDGFMAELEVQDAGGYVLYENHCPISSAVTSCAQLCDAELQIFKHVLGDDAVVERVEHMGAGDRRCSYRIVPKKG